MLAKIFFLCVCFMLFVAGLLILGAVAEALMPSPKDDGYYKFKLKALDHEDNTRE